MKLVLDYSSLHENHWFDLQRNLHHYEMQQNCFICVHIQHLWFTNSTVQMMEQDWILWTGYLHRVHNGEICRTFILFTGETWLFFSGCMNSMNSQSNMFLILILKCRAHGVQAVILTSWWQRSVDYLTTLFCTYCCSCLLGIHYA